MEGVAFWGGVVVGLVGAIILAAVIPTAVRRRRSRAAGPDRPQATISRARPGPVTLRGRVAVGPDGAIHEPLGGREVVWYRLTASAAPAGARGRGDHVEVHAERDARDFLIDDGSRSGARVAVEEAGVVVPRHVYGGSQLLTGADRLPWAVHELTEQQATALRDRCIRSPTRIERADLQSLEPGAAVTVVGWLEWERGDPVVVGRPPDHPLIVYGVPNEAANRDRQERSRRRRWGVAFLVLVMLAAGGAAAWWGRSTIGW